MINLQPGIAVSDVVGVFMEKFRVSYLSFYTCRKGLDSQLMEKCTKYVLYGFYYKTGTFSISASSFFDCTVRLIETF